MKTILSSAVVTLAYLAFSMTTHTAVARGGSSRGGSVRSGGTSTRAFSGNGNNVNPSNVATGKPLPTINASKNGSGPADSKTYCKDHPGHCYRGDCYGGCYNAYYGPAYGYDDSSSEPGVTPNPVTAADNAVPTNPVPNSPASNPPAPIIAVSATTASTATVSTAATATVATSTVPTLNVAAPKAPASNRLAADNGIPENSGAGDLATGGTTVSQ